MSAPAKGARRPFDLEAHLRARGLFDADGIRRTVRARHCRHCALVVLVGLDADVAGRTVIADPYALDGAGELIALLSGRATYRLWRIETGYELDLRDQFAIAGDKPNQRDARGQLVVVLAEHRCGVRLSDTPVTLRPPRPDYPEEPTF